MAYSAHRDQVCNHGQSRPRRRHRTVPGRFGDLSRLHSRSFPRPLFSSSAIFLFLIFFSQTVRLRTYDAIRRFLSSVPASYRRHIRHLDLCTLVCSAGICHPAQARAVVSLLTCCSRIEKLALRMAGSMDNAILSAFPHIPHLQELAISNCLPEEDSPV